MATRELIGTLALIGGACLSNFACVAHAQATGYAEADAPVVFAEPPTLVAVEPNVWVVRDYEYAVYYVDGFYWVYRANRWERSRSYEGGWVAVEFDGVPEVIVHRDHHAYVRFHGAANAETRPAPREHIASDDVHRGPPAHAGGPQGGPPGHDEIPGVGNQRKAEVAPAPIENREPKKPEYKDEHKKAHPASRRGK
jgi:hypothetical protein